MKKPAFYTFISLSLIVSSASLANNTQAPIDIVNSLAVACETTATEEQVDKNERQQFVSDCINAQLIEMGYQRQRQLAKTDETKENI
ncbi:hypothetical protein [Shewanella japonica]|uniref:hypothetical protein n=1 Tax=Shewanella japonica TaxID=93973 RepID=UPI000E72D78F|nr:hypothetical protein [Shewanella japonica]